MALEEIIDQDSLSMKAGPTEPGEKLSMVWVESFVYPKIVNEDKIISLGVRTTSKVKEVRASFDFSSEVKTLSSHDQQSWSTAIKVPVGLTEGVHVVRYLISNGRGSIQRTVEFFSDKPAKAVKSDSEKITQGVVAKSSGWPITVIATCNAYTERANRVLYSGQVLTSLSKMPWYKVVFEDGQQGWVPAAYVKEPSEDLLSKGEQDLKTHNYSAAIGDFKNVVAANPDSAPGYLGLAKSFAGLGDLDQASEAVRRALKLDDRIIESRVVADALAENFYSLGREKYQRGRYNEAIVNFRKALELKFNLVYAAIEMGSSYRRLGLEAEARSAWRDGLKIDPENENLRRLLGDRTKFIENTASTKSQPRNNVAPALADDSLRIIKSEKTRKGTKLESAVKSVLSLTKSLGTPIVEKGWQIKKQGEKFLVSYLCEQSGRAQESFDWLVDVDTRQVVPHNDNARLLMSRW